MPRVLCLALFLITTSAGAEPRNQIRSDLAVSGPGGMMAMRYSRDVYEGLRIEPAVGLGTTGFFASFLVTQPLTSWNRTTPKGMPYKVTLEAYGGYGISVLADGLHHPWSGNPNFIPNGRYHWVDFGLSYQVSWRNIVMSMGSGASVLVSAPMGIGGENPEDSDFWWFFPEGWMAKKHWVPTLWTGIGYAF